MRLIRSWAGYVYSGTLGHRSLSTRPRISGNNLAPVERTFRDDIRRFVKGDPAMVPDLMRRIYGSDDLFPDTRADAYHPYQSINYITSHDGFTLYDLVSYDRKHNWANGNNNQDGTDDNYSWNCGYEGDEAVPPEVLALAGSRLRISAAC